MRYLDDTANHEALLLIEDAERRTPQCAICGQRTAVTESDGKLWLDCTARAKKRATFRRFLTLDFAGHTHQPIADIAA